MEKRTKTQLAARNREITSLLGEMYSTAEKEGRTALNETELARELQLKNEFELNKMELANMMSDAELAKYREREDKNAQLREYLKGVREGKESREILLAPAAGNVTANIQASGAINLTIHEMIPTLHEGLGMPQGLRIVTGVTGNEIWPVSVNDVEMQELGEVEALTDQVLDFAKISPTPRRVGLTVPVSNMAIDNAAFDLLAFVQAKFTIALRKYLAEKLYSQAEWTGNKGPFSGASAAGTIDLTDGAYKAILKAIAAFSDKGFFEGDVCLVMDRETEAELKATPRLAGAAAGFVIENGLCAGYPYVVTHYLNTKLNAGGTALEPTDKKYIGIGYWEWFAVQSHGTARLSVDATSQGVAKKNITAVTLNMAWSFTDLSIYINGGSPVGSGNAAVYPSQAFALYEVEDGTGSN